MKNRISEKEKKQGKERIVKKVLFFSHCSIANT